jgi:tripartite-type tricarboxylate transporter receptor subunit TctC
MRAHCAPRLGCTFKNKHKLEAQNMSRSIGSSLRALLNCTLAVLTLSAGAAWAQAYPSKPVKVIVPFAAGGPADNYARFMAQRLQEALKQPFVVENKPGAGSVIGTDAVAKSPADGYTLLMMSNTQTVNESLIPNKPYGLMKDFVGIAPVNYSNLVLAVHPSVPAKTATELIQYAKANPGKLSYASSGNGTPYHMAGELFKYMAGLDILHVPYKGSSGARTDLIGGQVNLMFDAETTMAEFARQGKVRGLATSGLVRSTNLPDMPTVAESGVPKFEATIWLGLMAPRATPPVIVERLNAEVRRIVAQPDVQELWARQGAVPMSMSVAQFDQHLQADIAKWAEIIKVSGTKPE